MAKNTVMVFDGRQDIEYCMETGFVVWAKPRRSPRPIKTAEELERSIQHVRQCFQIPLVSPEQPRYSRDVSAENVIEFSGMG